MADKTTVDDDQSQEGNVETPDSTKKSRWQRWRRWITFAVASMLIIHTVGFTAYVNLSRNTDQELGKEVSLGEFHFIAKNSADSGIGTVEFNLHISLLTEIEGAARVALARNQFKVQQDVEELLRKANDADFEDPTLTELKRQIQETINSTIGKRVIEEVIITDLTMERVEIAQKEETQDMDEMPQPGITKEEQWTEKTPG